MRSMYQVLSKQERLQVASEGGTVEIRVLQFIRQCIPSCRRSHGKGTTTIRVQLEPWGDEQVTAAWLNRDAVVQRLERPACTALTSSRALGREDTCMPSSRDCTWPDLPHRASAAQCEGAVSDRGRTYVCRLQFALQHSWRAAACRRQSWVIRPRYRENATESWRQLSRKRQFLVEASLPWHRVNSTVHKQTEACLLLLFLRELIIKYNYNITYINTEFIQKVSITSDATLWAQLANCKQL